MKRNPQDIRQMILSRFIAITIVATLSGLTLGVADAQQQRQKGAPPEALAACEGKAQGDACSMVLRGKGDTVSGQCMSTPDQKTACLPEGAPRPPKS